MTRKKTSKLGEWILKQLIRKHMTQSDFAVRMGMDKGNFNKMITGERVPNLYTLCLMCEVFVANPVDAIIAYQQDFIRSPSRSEFWRKEREK